MAVSMGRARSSSLLETTAEFSARVDMCAGCYTARPQGRVTAAVAGFSLSSGHRQQLSTGCLTGVYT
jgi:hypothetical protein